MTTTVQAVLAHAPAATAGGLALLVAIALWRYQKLRGIPGPFWAQISRLWHVRHIIKGDQSEQFIALHEKHGHFVRIAHNEVSVSHPDALKAILLVPLHKAAWYSIIAFPDKRYQNPMSTTDPKLKVQRSKNLASGYTLTSLLRNEGSIDNVVGLLKAQLDAHAAAHKPMNLDEFFTYTTFDIVGESIFSKQFGFLREARDIGGSIRNSWYQNAYVAVIGFYPWLHSLIANPWMTSAGVLPFGHIVDTAMGAVKDREANPDARFDVLSHWFRALQDHPDRMSLFDVHSAATNAVAAGSDTVACGLQSFVYHMIRHPTAWARARAEIDATLAGSDVIQYTDAQSLPYLQACIKESLRVFSPVPMTLPRVAPAGGLSIGDKAIPEGTIVSVCPWVIHASTEIWGPDAREFNPDRWLGPDSAKLDKYYIPFGLGYASCPGHNLAKIQLSKILATIVRDYDIEQVDKGADWSYHTFFTVAPWGWPVYVTRRSKD
ncbi:cytochrome P450 [Microdochium bolleyi]|uniref:Cytochrome P450 n=1 Tax=Microdochium bolleyi TaxID=196109 RepID=A0A136IQC4_9PEZI|nr:cytochrome P450 [Microdochium bolleyi]